MNDVTALKECVTKAIAQQRVKYGEGNNSCNCPKLRASLAPVNLKLILSPKLLTLNLYT